MAMYEDMAAVLLQVTHTFDDTDTLSQTSVLVEKAAA